MSDFNKGSPPSMPDVKPSRGDESASASAKRHSNSNNRRGSKSGHRRSSAHKSERSPTREEEHSPSHSPRRSSGHNSSSRRSSSSKTPESSKRHQQSRRHLLRLADGGEEIHSPPLHQSENDNSMLSFSPSTGGLVPDEIIKSQQMAWKSAQERNINQTQPETTLTDHSGRSGSKRSSRTSLTVPSSSEKDNNNNNNGGRSSTRSSSRTSSARYSKTPDSKRQSSSRKLRLAEAGSVAPPPPLISDPFASTNITGSTRPRASSSTARTSFAPATTSMTTTTVAPNVDQILMGQDPATRMAENINNSNNNQWGDGGRTTPPLQATTAPNADEIEAARLQGREEGRNEGDKRHQRSGDNLVFMAAPAPKDHTAKKYAFASFVVVVVAAAIVVWQVMVNNNGKSNDTPAVPVMGPTPFDPPTQDDCLAASKGLAVFGQGETSVRTYAVEINFAVTSDMSLELLKAELEIRTQRYVLPLLLGCQIDGPIIIENNTFVIANAILETVTMNNPQTGCNLLDSNSTLCSLAYMEMDLFLKDPEVSSDYILELIAFVFQHKGLLEVLDLLTPIETIDTQREYEVFARPSSLPTPSPSVKPDVPIPIDDNLPSKETCLDIAEGKAVGGVLQEYDIYMDVMLDMVMDDLTTVTSELEEKLQRLLIPALAGCDPSFFLGNNNVPDNQDPADSTSPGSAPGTAPDTTPDGRPVLDGTGVDNRDPNDSTAPDTAPGDNLSFLDNNQNRRHLTTEGLILNAVVDAEHVIRGMCLTESDPPCYRYVMHLDIFVRSIVSSADFTEPLMEKFREEPLVPRLGLPSPFVRITVVDAVAQTPSALPSFSPSASPTTLAPSQVPSKLPSAIPSEVPSSNPTPQPTPRPTKQPTPGPTPFPTPRPTGRPTSSPTALPTPSPTRWPTPNPTASPTKPCISTNSDLITAANAYSPAPAPAPTKAAVVAQYGPIGDWCFGPGVTSMASLFEYYSDFNEDISNWDVSGVTDMNNMFRSAFAFNQNIGGWDVSSVTNMGSMFDASLNFNKNIGGWDVSSVTNMDHMFYGASAFNQNLASWDVSSVTDMGSMFKYASAFNQNIGSWDVSSVTNMGWMFYYASAFNQDLSNWDLTSLGSMEQMFYGASNFNQNLCDWDTDLVHSCIVSYAFELTNCPATWSPDLYWYPPYSPGPFCHTC